MAPLLSGKAWVCKTHIRGFDSRPRLMDTPPKPKTPYILDKEQDKRILEKLNKLAEKGFKDEKLLSLLYSQLETDWRSPLEEFIDKLLE